MGVIAYLFCLFSKLKGIYLFEYPISSVKAGTPAYVCKCLAQDLLYKNESTFIEYFLCA